MSPGDFGSNRRTNRPNRYCSPEFTVFPASKRLAFDSGAPQTCSPRQQIDDTRHESPLRVDRILHVFPDS